jgi:hypothetical protein
LWVISPDSDSAPASISCARGGKVVMRPFGGDAQPRLAHEGGREGKLERLGVEPGQHHLAALGDPGDQGVEQRTVALAS